MKTETINIKSNSKLRVSSVKNPSTAKRSDHGAKIISGFRKHLIEFAIRLQIMRLVVANYRSAIRWIRVLSALDRQRRNYLGESRIKKITKIDGRYHWDLYIPGFPSQAFNDFFRSEMHRISTLKIRSSRFTNVFFAITKKCPLQCEHCFEWDVLNKKENLLSVNLDEIVLKLQDLGTCQIQLTGGEPMMRFKDILRILEMSNPNTEFWMLSSGYDLNAENARKLKQSGLKGVVISIDHFEPDLHNLFRANNNSFIWAQNAIANSQASSLVTAISICVTKAFVSMENLMSYAELAKKMGVSFIQILEPKAVGHYNGQDVSLSTGQLKILEDFYWRMNFSDEYLDYPIVNYHGFHQRKAGCFSSGNRNMYIDTDGDLLACPFCRTKMGNILSEGLNLPLLNLMSVGCSKYKSVYI